MPSSLKGSPSETQLLASKLDRETPDVSDADRGAIVRADTAFAFDLYAEVTEGKANTFLSPYSIAVALSMTYAGAKGATAEQMANVLHIALPAEEMHRARNAVDQAITEPNQTDEAVAGGFEPLRLQVTNSLWGQLGYDFRGQFLDLPARHYGAGMRLVNYRESPEGSRSAINQWVEEATERRIVDLIPPEVINEMTRLVLVNAIHFQGNWLFKFDAQQTTRGEFTLLDGRRRSVPMMRIDRKYHYGEGDGWKAVQLPYAGGASMLVISPDEGRFEDVESGLDSGFLDGIRSELDEREVDLAMPRFEFDSRFSLAETLMSLGMIDAFRSPPGPSTADFTGLARVRELFLRDVVHKGFVSVDEQGTEAAAATGGVAEAVSGSCPSGTKRPALVNRRLLGQMA